MTKYFVISRVYDNGKVEAEIMLESEYTDQLDAFSSNEKYDEYIDSFDSFEDVEYLVLSILYFFKSACGEVPASRP